eukprot:9223298-Alexandrium_andersonii.AAC.1
MRTLRLINVPKARPAVAKSTPVPGTPPDALPASHILLRTVSLEDLLAEIQRRYGGEGSQGGQGRWV